MVAVAECTGFGRALAGDLVANAFGKVFGVDLTPAGCALLALSCWLVYATDYIFDGFRALPGSILAPRHEFYRVHRKSIIVLIVAAGIGSIGLAAASLNSTQFRDRLAMSILVGIYLLAIHLAPITWRARRRREFAVATLFTIGTFFWIWAELASGRNRLLVQR